jgi:hypothetical protein
MVKSGLGRRRAVSFPIVACAVLGSLAACSPRHAMSLPSSAAPAPACSTPPRATIVIQLGGTGLRGNSTPVVAAVPHGDVLAVSATFGERELSYPATETDVLVALCDIRRGWTYTTYFRARGASTAQVASQAASCGPCIQPGFTARSVVSPPWVCSSPARGSACRVEAGGRRRQVVRSARGQ